MEEACDSGESRQSRLLSLPPEIRNIIYRHTLIETQPISIDNHAPPPQPGFLQVNCQLREEANQIYYKENRFDWCFYNFNAAMYIKWSQTSRARHRCNARLCFTFDGALFWDSLLQWVKATHFKKAPGIAIDENEPEGFETAATQVFSAARNLKQMGMSWEKIEQQMEAMHLALAALDRAWK